MKSKEDVEEERNKNSKQQKPKARVSRKGTYEEDNAREGDKEKKIMS